jgi:hypothetical protein
MLTEPIVLPVRVSLATPRAWVKPLEVTAPVPDKVKVIGDRSAVSVLP